jgi:PiT family inorganic phosphate transporter
MHSLLFLTVVTVVAVVVFDYTNGFHDASNIVATVIASRAMTPVQAITLVAFFEFLGPLLGGTAVANTIGHFVRIHDLPSSLSVIAVLCGVLGAISWNLLTWWLGIPSSSSHALVGGLVGTVLLAAGPDHVAWGVTELLHGRLAGITKVILALVLSPLIGFAVGFAIHRFMCLLLRAARPAVNRHLKRVQFLTAAGLAFSHGANDAQKSMGVITMLLVLSGFLPRFVVPLWVILLCASAITLGIMSGGWRIVRTVGFGIYKVRPLHAVDAQLTAGSVVLFSALFGAPVSTTHVVSSSIMGIGASERARAVRWKKAKDIVGAWVVTFPAAAIVSVLLYALACLLLPAGG